MREREREREREERDRETEKMNRSDPVWGSCDLKSYDSYFNYFLFVVYRVMIHLILHLVS